MDAARTVMRILALICLPLVVTGLARAEDRESPPPGGPGGPGRLMEHADRNRDGAISFAEFSSLERVRGLPEEKRRRLFARLDKNGDGLIRRDEMPKPPQGRDRRPPLDLKKMDKNRDGAVDFEEFLAGPLAARLPEERRRAFFDRLDRNGDGRLSAEDHPRRGGPPDPGRRGQTEDPARLFKRLDTNADGKLDFREFRKAPWIAGLGEDAQEDRFEALDRNGDLALDPSEMVPPRDEDRPRKPRRPEDPRRGGPQGDGPPPGPRPPMEGGPMMEEGA